MNGQSIKKIITITMNLLIVGSIFAVVLTAVFHFTEPALKILKNAMFPDIDLIASINLIAILSFIIALFLAGVLSSRLNEAFIKSSATAICLGAATGSCIGIFLFIENTILNFAVFPDLFSNDHYLFHFVGALMIYDPIFLAIFAFLGVPGSYACYIYYRLKPKKKEPPGKAGAPGLRRAVISLLLVAVFSFIVLYLIYSTGSMRYPDDEARLTPDANISVQRLSNDTITITNNGGSTMEANGKVLGTLDTNQPFTIYLANERIGENDVSSALSISKSGLNVSISPSSGLGRENGSSVTLTGSDIQPVTRKGTHIFVAAHYQYQLSVGVYDQGV